jgi:hypothetical protein
MTFTFKLERLDGTPADPLVGVVVAEANDLERPAR